MENQKKERLFVDIHVLQTVPPSCLNRDDTGSPKTAIYGGTTRSRVSSQSWKHAMRGLFKENMPKEDLAYRTKEVMQLIIRELESRNYPEDTTVAAEALLTAAGMKLKKNAKTGLINRDALFFISNAQVRALVDLLLSNSDFLEKSSSKEYKAMAQLALKQNPGIDIALFGRMVAEEPSLNTDASSQVAHAISTHSVSTEFDFFTAVDDLAPEDNAGAGHIGTVEFNSATLYRYATLAVHDLNNNLGEVAKDAVTQFVQAFVYSMPTGKQNTFANRTLPDVVQISLREDQPVNFVGAFEKAVPISKEGYVQESARRLVAHEDSLSQTFMKPAIKNFYVGSHFAESRPTLSFAQALDEVSKVLSEKMSS